MSRESGSDRPWLEGHPGARALLLGACLVVVVGGLRVAAPILVPFALALFLTVLSLPLLLWLRKRKVPGFLAVAVTVLVNAAVFGLVVLLAIQSVSDFQDRYLLYASRFRGLWATWVDALQSRNVPIPDQLSPDPSSVFAFIGSALQGAASVVSGAFLVLIILVFILSEATVFPQKFRAIFRREPVGPRGRMQKTVKEVQDYLGIKTLVSLTTGILIGLWAWSSGLDFPVLLGLIGFVLNYIPTVGSVLASVPAVFLALIQYSAGHAALVAVGYLVINVVLGNFIEPTLLGRRLGLSSLVVILSLLFWGWVWGPVGMLLAVPLTMVMKIMLENTQDLKWAAVLLDKSPPARTSRGGSRPEPAAPVVGTPAATPSLTTRAGTTDAA
ncbi:MAG: AI-2E family transporter [Gemmatimonadota bacterium]